MLKGSSTMVRDRYSCSENPLQQTLYGTPGQVSIRFAGTDVEWKGKDNGFISIIAPCWGGILRNTNSAGFMMRVKLDHVRHKSSAYSVRTASFGTHWLILLQQANFLYFLWEPLGQDLQLCHHVEIMHFVHGPVCHGNPPFWGHCTAYIGCFICAF